ncbi:photosystem reaction center subunit H [Methylobacterium sp. Leaf104]|uniref:PRC-barrel domain-containing protein n=1 Tax=Methylobacterium TaxID=407 RepID=UPI000701BA72|nr:MULTISPECIES: PRC-barrel domain-containing protein [Methylobacterium]KQP42941.1 photosystem reaction center subunit H [Methylobacterium sp. Leaf104]MCI9878443.1 PRC-barrel domain-containing protein [Methylobacterium goesingense]
MPPHHRSALLLALSVLAAPTLSGGRAYAQPAAEQPGAGFLQARPGAMRGSKIIGLPVVGMDHVRVGSIEDVLIGDDGKVQAVVIGVGGFLGIGEKLVAVPYDAVAWNMKDVPLTGGPTSVATPETKPGPQAAAEVKPETMPGADTTRDVLGAVQDKHTDRVTSATGTIDETKKPAAGRATALAGGVPLEAEIRLTKAQINAAPAFQYGAARKAEQ